MSEHALFVGYPRLETWADIADPTKPVYATYFSHPNSPDTGSPVVHDLLVMVAQPDAHGIVHYCRLRAASLTMLYGKPFDSDADARFAAQTDLWTLVKAWLLEGGFTLREGVFDTPKDLIHLNGQAGFVTWDRDARCYCRADLTAPTRPEADQ